MSRRPVVAETKDGVVSSRPDQANVTGPLGKFRNIHGGLDNAVRYANEKGLHDLFIVDVDCHQREPFMLFAEYVDEPWRSILGKTDISYDYDSDPFFGGHDEGIGTLSPRTVNRNLSGRIRRTEIRSALPRIMDDPKKVVRILELNFTPEEFVDVFVERFRDIGIKRCIVFPNWMLNLGWDPRAQFEVALCNAYMDYMLEHFLGKYPEILTVVSLPANSPDRAAELIDRVGSEKGVVGVGVTANREGLAGDASWDAVYAAADRKGLPICFHAGTQLNGPFSPFDKYLPIHAISFPFFLARQLTSVIFEGVPERFPNLKFVFMEGGVSWIPWMQHRLDNEYLMRESEAPLLTRLPSEYMREFYYSSQPIEHPVDIMNLQSMFVSFDAENHLMYASDYPHQDFDAPSTIYDLPFLSEDAKKRILGGNAAKLFRIS